MFGKNYDEEIKDLYKKINQIIEMQNKNQDKLLQIIKDNQDLISSFQKSLIEMAKVQATHKEAIMLLSKRWKLASQLYSLRS